MSFILDHLAIFVLVFMVIFVASMFTAIHYIVRLAVDKQMALLREEGLFTVDVVQQPPLTDQKEVLELIRVAQTDAEKSRKLLEFAYRNGVLHKHGK